MIYFIIRANKRFAVFLSLGNSSGSLYIVYICILYLYMYIIYYIYIMDSICPRKNSHKTDKFLTVDTKNWFFLVIYYGSFNKLLIFRRG